VTDPITIVLADDHMLVREGLKKILQADSQFKVVGEAENGRAVVELVRQLQPMVVLMDIAMPLLNGIEATRQILKSLPATRILILSAHCDDVYLEHLNELGVAGYVLKHTSSQVLGEAIHQIAKGEKFFEPSVSRRLRNESDKTHLSNLSPREVEVLQLIAEGEANKQIASELNISIKTVEKHRQNVMNKLRIHDTAGLTRYAIGAGIIESSVQGTVIHPPHSQVRRSHAGM
jgi:DNA-binding NarL/FixJ family response regulator